jgi:hypothetical protein
MLLFTDEERSLSERGTLDQTWANTLAYLNRVPVTKSEKININIKPSSAIV